jgi:leucine-zipper of insertion element IS481
MSMARLAVTAVLAEGRSKREVARDYKVSRRWVVTPVQRLLAEGDAGLEPRSRRPKRIPGQLAIKVEDEIVAVRKELTDLGHDAGAHTIAFHLERRHGGAPSPSPDGCSKPPTWSCCLTTAPCSPASPEVRILPGARPGETLARVEHS